MSIYRRGEVNQSARINKLEKDLYKLETNAENSIIYASETITKTVASESTIDKSLFDFENLFDAFEWLNKQNNSGYITIELEDGIHYTNRIINGEDYGLLLISNISLSLIGIGENAENCIFTRTNDSTFASPDIRYMAGRGHLIQDVTFDCLHGGATYANGTGGIWSSNCRVDIHNCNIVNGWSSLYATEGGVIIAYNTNISKVNFAVAMAQFNGTIKMSGINTIDCSEGLYKRGFASIFNSYIKIYDTTTIIDTVKLMEGLSDNSIIDTSGLVLSGTSSWNISTDKIRDDGSIAITQNNWTGTTAERPSLTEANEKQFFDTTLGKPIWYDGTNWVDATGTTV